MKWTMNSASIIGNSHVFERTNRQDFVATRQDDDFFCGVVCDGCGSSKYSEFGAVLIGTALVNRLNSHQFKEVFNADDADVLKLEINLSISQLLRQVAIYLLDDTYTAQTSVDFIENYLLSTFVFVMASDKRAIVGYCGDGIIILNDQAQVIDQGGEPYYIAYHNVPRQYLKDQTASLLQGTTITILKSDVHKIVIATDGLKPLLDQNRMQELFNTTGRQLQRKFNVWQTKEKLFDDDATCIVLEQPVEQLIEQL